MKIALPQRFESDELYMRPVEMNDAQALWQGILSDPETMRDLSIVCHQSVWETERFLAEQGAEDAGRTCIRYVQLCKRNSDITALVELRIIGPAVELGVAISGAHTARKRRSGILLLQAFMKKILEIDGIYRIFATCALDGKAQSCMERLGFQKEAILLNFESRPNRKMKASDSVLYAMTRNL